jgi:hypothetical protein
MADLRISQLPALAGADLSATDLLAVADVSASETKKLTSKDLIQYGVAIIDDGSINGSKLATSSVNAAQLGANSVGSSELADDAVDTAAIANLAVTSAKIASGVDGAKLSDGTVTAAKIATASLDRGLDKVSGAIGHANSVTAGTFNGITFDTQGHITATTAIAASSLPVATTTTAGIVSVPSASGLSVSGVGALSHTSSITGATVSGITFNNSGHITAATALVAADLPNATTTTKGAVTVPAGDLTVTSGSLTHTLSGAAAGTYTKVTVTTTGHITAGTTLSAADIPSLPASKITSGLLDIALFGTNSITGAKLANNSTVQIGGATSTSGIVTFPSPQFTGEFFFDANNADLYLYDGNTWQPITVISGNLVYAGTYNAATNTVRSVTTQGSAIGLTIGAALPAASATNLSYYVVVSDSGTGVSPAPVVALAPPDMLVSSGTTWDHVDVSNAIAGQTAGNISLIPYAGIAANNVQTGIQELEDEKLSKTGGTVTGELLIGTAGSLAFEGTTANAAETFLTVVDPTADRTITFPDISGTVVTSGDTGTVTSTMILDGTILNVDINASAAIAGSKIQAATTSNAGAVQLTDSTSSTSTTTAATPNSVKSAYDLANAALPGAGGTLTGNVTLNAQSDLRFADSDSSNWVAFQAPTTVGTNVTWTLPGTDGTNGQVLSTNGTGTLSWATSSAPVTSVGGQTGAVTYATSWAVGTGATAAANTDLDVAGTYAQTVVAVSALDIDCSTGNYFTKTINGNSTFTVSSIPASRAYAFTLELTHTSGTITWFSGVEWPAGTAPTLTTGKTHLFLFVTDDGGTRWRASSLINYTN